MSFFIIFFAISKECIQKIIIIETNVIIVVLYVLLFAFNNSLILLFKKRVTLKFFEIPANEKLQRKKK